MAQRSPDLACFICGQNPCECNKAKKKPLAPKESPVRAAEPEASPASDSSRKPISGIKSPPVRVVPAEGLRETPKPEPKPSNILAGHKSSVSKKDPILTAAFLSLITRFDIDVKFVKKHRDQLDLPDWKIDMLIWKGELIREARARANRRGPGIPGGTP